MMPGMNWNNSRIFVYRGVCDLRRSFDKLAQMVLDELHENPLSGDWFVFLGTDRKKIKVLYWDRDGYALWYKRLEKGKFVLPEDESSWIDRTAWVHLLEGVRAEIIKRQPRYRLNGRQANSCQIL
jgi:transposase